MLVVLDDRINKSQTIWIENQSSSLSRANAACRSFQRVRKILLLLLYSYRFTGKWRHYGNAQSDTPPSFLCVCERRWNYYIEKRRANQALLQSWEIMLGDEPCRPHIPNRFFPWHTTVIQKIGRLFLTHSWRRDISIHLTATCNTLWDTRRNFCFSCKMCCVVCT